MRNKCVLSGKASRTDFNTKGDIQGYSFEGFRRLTFKPSSLAMLKSIKLATEPESTETVQFLVTEKEVSIS